MVKVLGRDHLPAFCSQNHQVLVYTQDTYIVGILGQHNTHVSLSNLMTGTISQMLPEAVQTMGHLCFDLTTLQSPTGKQISRYTPHLRHEAEKILQLPPMISTCSISMHLTLICAYIHSCSLREKKIRPCLPLLLGILFLFTMWYSAWLILTNAWHINYRRSKNFISRLQFLDEVKKHRGKCCSQ